MSGQLPRSTKRTQYPSLVRIKSLLALILAISLIPIHTASALHSLEKKSSAPQLANPGLLIIDPTDGRVLSANQPDSPRVPASVIKVVTSVVALQYLGGGARYATSIWDTANPGEFILRGSLDPYLTSTRAISERFGHRYLPTLISKANQAERKRLKIFYNKMYPRDIEDLAKALKVKGIRTNFVAIESDQVKELGITEIATLTSEPLDTMISHTILWSDNRVADRLAKAAARRAGNPTTSAGLTKTYKEVLTSLAVDSTGLKVHDGSGLSKSNRVSARTVVELLTRIRNEPLFASIYAGLPIAGETGTLVKRFSKAPLAIGHVHAKTGWVNRSVTMAGYIESGDKEYVFAILADGIVPSLRARNAARNAMDRLLETVVKGDH